MDEPFLRVLADNIVADIPPLGYLLEFLNTAWGVMSAGAAVGAAARPTVLSVVRWTLGSLVAVTSSVASWSLTKVQGAPHPVVDAVRRELAGDCVWEPSQCLLVTSHLIAEIHLDTLRVGSVKANGVPLPPLSSRDNQRISSMLLFRAAELNRKHCETVEAERAQRERKQQEDFIKAMSRA